MAHFRATIQGQRGQASRLGSPKSGLVVSANGWDVGVKVCGGVDKDGVTRFSVYLTGGSNDRFAPVHLGTFTESDIRNAQPIKAIG
jgi:hypothetical protein